MTDEVTQDTGSLDAAAASLKEARQATAPQEDGNKQPEESDGATETATTETPDTETPAPEQAGEDEVDPVAEGADQESPIEPPARWTAEDKEWFKTLPPDRQERILRGEQGQRAAEVKRQQELAAERERYQQEAQAAAQERQYFQSRIQQYRHPVEDAFRQQFADVISGQTDLFRLAQDQQRWPIYQAFQAKFHQIAEAEQMLSHRAQQDEQARLSQYIEARNTKLFETRPELKDPAKFQKFDEDVTTYLRGYNVPDDRIGKISYEELDIVEKAMKWDAAQKAKANVPKPPQPGPGQTRVQPHVRALPRVIKPGTPSDAGVGDEKITAIDQRARQSGSVDDAAERLRLRRINIRRA